MALRTAERKELGVAQLGERYLGVVEAASSSLVTQTKHREYQNSRFFFVFTDFFALFGVRFFCFLPSLILPMVEAST